MAFNIRNFTAASFNQSSVPNSWEYVTTDAIATVLASGYFNEVYDLLAVKDIIKVSASNAISFVKVATNASKVVTTTDGADLA